MYELIHTKPKSQCFKGFPLSLMPENRAKNNLRKWIRVLSISISIIPASFNTLSNFVSFCQIQANPSGAEFLRTISKFRKTKKISWSLVCVLHKTWNTGHSHVVVVQYKKLAALALLFCSTKLLLLWRSRHRGRRTLHLKLRYTCGSRLLHGGYCWKVIHFNVAISSFSERKTSNRDSESYLVPIMWTKYLSVLTIISTRQSKHFRPPSFLKLRRNT